jgi:hypothetical protein
MKALYCSTQKSDDTAKFEKKSTSVKQREAPKKLMRAFGVGASLLSICISYRVHIDIKTGISQNVATKKDRGTTKLKQSYANYTTVSPIGYCKLLRSSQ